MHSDSLRRRTPGLRFTAGLAVAPLVLAASAASAQTYWSETSPLSAVTARDAVAADFDRDGDMDLAILDSNGNQLHLVRNRASALAIVQTLSLSSFACGLDLGDIDGDSQPDLLVGTGNRLGWVRTVGLTMEPEITIATTTEEIRRPKLGDFDDDGDLDVVTGYFAASTTVWYENDGEGSFAAAAPIAAVGRPREFVVANFDADEADEAIVVMEGGSTSFLDFVGDGIWAVSNLGNDVRQIAIAAGDLDDDGDMDIALGGHDDSRGLVWRANDGLGGFGAAVTIETNMRFGDVGQITIVDVDDDGLDDVVISAPYSFRIAWYPNLGGSLGTARLFDATANVSSSEIRAFDVDGDDDLDLISNQPTVGFTVHENPLYGQHSLLTSIDANVGSNCDAYGNGGSRIRAGVDDGTPSGYVDNGTLDDGEVDATAYLCNGADGADGTNGTDGVDGTNGTDGVDGTNGTDGVDGTNGTDGVDGTNGTDGVDGMNGTDGRSPLLAIDSEAAGANCADGGNRVRVGYDADADATLDDAEVMTTSYLCAATPVVANGGCSMVGTSRSTPSSLALSVAGAMVLLGLRRRIRRRI